MKSSEEFKAFHQRELKQPIEKLEQQRLALAEKYSYAKYRRNLKWLSAAAALVLLSKLVFPDRIPTQVVVVIMGVVLYALIAPLYISFSRNEAFPPIKDEYKKTVVPKIISFVGPDLAYKPTEGITLDEFIAGGLYLHSTDFKAEDLVTGNVGSLQVRMSDLYVVVNRYQNQITKTGKSEPMLAFAGLYAIARVPFQIPSRVLIKPTNVVADAVGAMARKVLGDNLVDTINAIAEYQDIETGYEEFDKIFDVTCESPEVARALLTPTLIQLILAFKKETISPLSFAFFDDQFHLGFPGINLFEIDAHTVIGENDASAKYFQQLNLVIGIGEALRLTRPVLS